MKEFPFKKIFFATLFYVAPFSLLEAFLALFNVVPVNFNNKDVYGIEGFFIAIIFMPFIAIMLSGFTWFFLNFGFWLYTLFCRLLNPSCVKTGQNKLF